MPRAPRIRFSLVRAVLLLGAAIGRSAAQNPTPPSAPATYSDSQAAVGQQWFLATCESCHALDEITSADFKTKWGGRTAFDLFDQIQRTMPEAEPGSLPRRAYVDIVAYLMKQNGVTATSSPLADNDSTLAATILQCAGCPRP